MHSDLQPLVGSWRLASGGLTFVDTRERIEPWGPNPEGCMVLEPGGRVAFFFLSADRRPAENDADRAALFTGMMIYSGLVRPDGPGRVITRIDLSWNPAWGGEQLRHVAIDGDRLRITTDAFSPPRFPDRLVVGDVTFVREHPAPLAP